MKKPFSFTCILVILIAMSFQSLAQIGDINSIFGKKKKKDEQEKKEQEKPKEQPVSKERPKQLAQALEWYENTTKNAIFAAQPVNSTTLPAGDQTYSFQGGTVYCRFVFDKKLKEIYPLLDQDHFYNIIFQVLRVADENETEWSKFQKNILEYKFYIDVKADGEKNYIDIPLIPKLRQFSIATGQYSGLESSLKSIFEYAKFFGKEPGKHKYKFGIKPDKGVKMYSYGEFEYEDVGGNLLNEMDVSKKEAVNYADSMITASHSIPDEYYTSMGQFKDPKLSIINIKNVIMEMEDVAQILKLSIGKGEDWKEVMKSYPNNGIPDYKFTNRSIYLIYKDKKGDCRYAKIEIQRKYSVGDRAYGDMSAYRENLDNNNYSIKVFCNKVKK